MASRVELGFETCSEPMTAKLTPTLERQVKALAAARDQSPSELIRRVLQEHVNQEYQRLRKLSEAFGVDLGLPDDRDGESDDV